MPMSLTGEFQQVILASDIRQDVRNAVLALAKHSQDFTKTVFMTLNGKSTALWLPVADAVHSKGVRDLFSRYGRKITFTAQHSSGGDSLESRSDVRLVVDDRTRPQGIFTFSSS